MRCAVCGIRWPIVWPIRQQGARAAIAMHRLTCAHLPRDRALRVHLGVFPLVLPGALQPCAVAVTRLQEAQQTLLGGAAQVGHRLYRRAGIERPSRLGGVGR